jgi:hypothetical protein
MTRSNRLHHRGDSVEFTLVDGLAAVVETRGGVTRRFGPGEWSRLRRGGMALAHAYHRGELGIESLLPSETVEAMHAVHASRPARLARRLRLRAARWVAALRPVFSAS